MRRIAIAIICFAAAATLRERPAAFAAIPAGPDAHTQKEVVAQRLQFVHSLFVDAYDRAGKKNPAWDDQARALLELFAQAITQDSALRLIEKPMPKELLRNAKDLVVDKHCTDPLVHYVYGYAQQAARDPYAEATLTDAVDELSHSKYPSLCTGLAAERLATLLEKTNRPGDAIKQHHTAIDAFIKALDSSEFPKDQPRLVTFVFLPIIDEDMSPKFVAEFAARLRDKEAVDPWAINTLLGVAELRAAWQARGARTADRVKDAQWKGFEERLALARKHLSKAYSLDASLPEPAAFMIRVTVGESQASPDTPRLWFDRAVAAQFDWIPAYGRMLWGLRPRWQGSLDEMYSLGLEAKDTGRFDTNVPFQYVQALIDISFDTNDFDFWKEHDVYPAVAEVLTRTAERPEHASDVARLRTLHAGCAHRMGKFAESRRLLEQLGDSFDPVALTFVTLTRRELTDAAYLFTSSQGKKAEEAEQLFSEGEYAKAATLYEGVVAGLAGDPKVLPAAQDRVESCRLAAISTTAWTPIRFAPDLAGWRVRSGSWKATEHGIASAGRGAPCSILCQAPVGRRWEMRGQIDLTGFAKNPGGFVAIMTSFDHDFEYQSFQGAILAPGDKAAAVTFRLNMDEKHPAAIAPGVNAFSLKWWDDTVYFAVGDVVVFAGEAPTDPGWQPGDLIGLFVRCMDAADTAEFTNLEIRRLASRPEEPKAAPGKGAPKPRKP